MPPLHGPLRLAVLGAAAMLTTWGLGVVTANTGQPVPFDLPIPAADGLQPRTAARAATMTPALATGTPQPAAATARATAGGADLLAITRQEDQKVLLVDPVAPDVTRTIDIGAPIDNIASTPDGASVWVFSSKPTESDFFVVDLAKGEQREGKRLRDGPHQAAFSSDGQRAYIALAGGNDSPPGPSTIVFLNTAKREEVGHVVVGRQTPGVQIRRRVGALAAVAGPAGDVLYAAGQASGTVWALDGGSGKLLAELEVGGGPLALLPDPARHSVHAVLDTLNQIDAIDTTTQAITSRVDLPGAPSAAAIGHDGTLYVTSAEAGEVWIVGPNSKQVDRRVSVGRQPSGVAVSLDGQRAYVVNRGDGTLSIVDTAQGRAAGTIPIGNDPVSVVVVPKISRDATPAPAATPVAQPSPTPTMVPTPTPLPQGALPPEHMLPNVVSEPFVPHAEFPVALAFAPDGRLFYNELHSGKVRVVQNGALLADPFWQVNVSGQPEAGLIGLTLDPDFATNHYLYVLYTSVPDGQDNGGTNGPNQVVRLTADGNTATHPTPILPDLPSGPIHNAGHIGFGPDGKLYVSIGDNDKGNSAQNLGTLAGKILRFNADGTVPDDNPFVNQAGKQPGIWAYGLRNPFSFAFHPTSQGLLAVENGPGDNDELDVIVKGGNYGWPPTGYKNKPGVTDPIAVMNPPIGPTGTAFYVGEQIPEWKNDWFYCNFHQGQLRRVHLAPGSLDRIVFEEVVKQGCLLAVATGPDGALYYSDAKGVYRLRAASAAGLPVVADSAASAAAAAPAPAEVLPEGTRAEDRDVNISMSEWKLAPSRTRVPAGQIRVLAENVGATHHALRIVGQGLDVSTDDFDPGQSRSVTAGLAPGTYQLICPVPGHADQGMATRLTVVGP